MRAAMAHSVEDSARGLSRMKERATQDTKWEWRCNTALFLRETNRLVAHDRFVQQQGKTNRNSYV